jgi:beta-glucosidase
MFESKIVAVIAMALLAAFGCSDDSGDGNGSGDGSGAVPPPASPLPMSWTDDTAATERAQGLLARMDLDQKVNMLHGELNFFYGFYNAPIEDLVIPALTTQLPSGPALAATWDLDLAEQYGDILGSEAYLTSHNVVLGPSMDLLRTLQWGRAFESFSEDPMLSGEVAAAVTRSIQRHPVVATLKHWVGYNQEALRTPVHPENEQWPGYKLDVVADERTLQEMYIRPFAIAVRDGAPGAVMCGFQAVNGVYGCEDKTLLQGVLKDQLGFQGWVMSDYGSIYSTVPSIMGGADQEMPGNFTPEVGPGTCFFCGPLLDAVRGGQVPLARIDDAVTRILRPMYGLRLFDDRPVAQPLPEREHGAMARSIAEQSIVLLKNEESVLPLGPEIHSIAVIGTDADTIIAGGGSAHVLPTYAVGPLEAIRRLAGANVTVEHALSTDPITSAAILPGPDPLASDFLTPPDGSGHGLRVQYFTNPDFAGEPILDRTEPYAALNGGFQWWEGFAAPSLHAPLTPPRALADNQMSARWTGTLTAPVTGAYELVLFSVGTSRLFVDGEEVTSTESLPGGASSTSTATLQLDEGSEHAIRVEYAMDTDKALVNYGPMFKLAWNPPQGVVTPTVRAAAELARNSDVAIVFVHDYASEDQDRPSLDLPFGQAELIRQVAAANPRTVVVLRTSSAVRTSTWDDATPAVLQAWYGGQEQGNAIARVLFGEVNPSGKLPITIPVDESQTPISTPEQYPGTQTQQYSEGIFVGYRGYEERGLTPRYPFGHGLSYTTFEYSDLRILPVERSENDKAPPIAVTVNVRNTGAVAGSEVVQAYVGRLPAALPTAAKSLAGHGKVMLAPGEAQDVTIYLARESLSYWDADADQWVLPSGTFPILIGASSADIRLNGQAKIGATSRLAMKP